MIQTVLFLWKPVEKRQITLANHWPVQLVLQNNVTTIDQFKYKPMKKLFLLLALLPLYLPLNAWWDAGHLVTAFIAYENLNPTAKAKVDELTAVLQRDYPYLNHFVTLAAWPDDLKSEGVYQYNDWHYTNIPYNPRGVALPPQPNIDIIWAIGQNQQILGDEKPRPLEKARNLAFLTHFLGDIHQPLHSTSYYNDDLPSGNRGGNDFPIATFGKWRNLHACWDDGCGYTSSLNDINPYGSPKVALTKADIMQLSSFAEKVMAAHPKADMRELVYMDPDFWALEGHKLAVEYGYRGVQRVEENGRKVYIQPNDPPSDLYLENGQRVVERRLAMGGYRLAAVLNALWPEE